MNVDFPPALLDLVQRQLSQYGRCGAPLVVQSPAVNALGAGNTSSPVQVKFPVDGVVVAMYGQELAGTAAAFAGTSVRIQVGGSQDLFIDGQGGGAFVPMLALFGSTQNWYALTRMVKPEIPWAVTFKNNLGVAITPVVGFSYFPLSQLR